MNTFAGAKISHKMGNQTLKKPPWECRLEQTLWRCPDLLCSAAAEGGGDSCTRRVPLRTLPDAAYPHLRSPEPGYSLHLQAAQTDQGSCDFVPLGQLSSCPISLQDSSVVCSRSFSEGSQPGQSQTVHTGHSLLKRSFPGLAAFPVSLPYSPSCFQDQFSNTLPAAKSSTQGLLLETSNKDSDYVCMMKMCPLRNKCHKIHI